MSGGVEPKTKTRRGCFFYVLILAFGLPFLIALLLLALVSVRDASASRKLNDRIEALQAEGKPYDSDSMGTYYDSLTNSEDTAAWQAILNELDGEDFRNKSKGVPIFDGQVEGDVPYDSSQEWPEENATRRFLEDQQDLHDRIMRLSMKSRAVRFPIEWNSIQTLLPHAQTMRSAGRLLSLRGKIAIRDGDSAALRRSLDSLLGCSKVLSSDPVLISQLVATAIDGIGIGLLQDGLEEGMLREQDLKALLPKYLEGVQIGPAWQHSMHGERAMMLPIFQGTAEVDLGTGGLPEVLSSLPFRSRDANLYMDILDKALACETNNIDEFSKNLQVIEEEMQLRFGGPNIFASFDSALTGLLTPALSAAGEAFVRIAVQHRIASMAIGTRLYHLEHQEFPESLADLDEYGLDADELRPLGGKPFGYQVDQEGALLWGFSKFSGDTSTPAQPPETDDDGAYSAQAELWRWRVSTGSKQEKPQ